MSQIQSYLSSRSALEPVHTKGNAFWRGNERFLIKGISYRLFQPTEDSPGRRGPEIDLLSERRLDDLKRDIAMFRELGLNTIQVAALDPSNNHEKAINLLAEAGIYVLVKICDDIEHPDVQQPGFDSDFDTTPYYPGKLLTSTLKVVDDMADYPNLLGFVVSSNALRQPLISKIAEVSRAAITDVKHYLRLREGRKPPVGISVSDLLQIKLDMLKYFTAGASQDRADFHSLDCWSWAHKSSFQISGWKNMVEAFAYNPAPMFLAAFGSYTGRPRLWEDVECLYSRDMTAVFSGGCVYTYFTETGANYGLVRIDKYREAHKKPEFERLKQHFHVVNQRAPEELYSAETKDYESWQGDFPTMQDSDPRWPRQSWYATSNVPTFSGDWMELLQELQDAKLRGEMANLSLADDG